MDISFTAGNYNLVDLSGTGSLTYRGLTHTTGANSIAARVISSANATISGGTLSLSNTSLTAPNSLSGTWSVSSGAALNVSFGGAKPVSGPSGSSALGAASLALSGGRVVFAGKVYDAAGQVAQPVTTLGNDVTLSGNSTIVASNTLGVTLGTLHANSASAKLTIGDTAADGLVRFANTSFETSGTFTFQTNADLALGKIVDGNNTVQLVKIGAAALILDDNSAGADKNGTSVSVQSGTLRAAASSVLDGLTAIRVSSGATLDFAASASFGSSSPRIVSSTGSILRVSNATALSGGGSTTFAVRVGQILQVASSGGLTGTATIAHPVGMIVSLPAGDTLTGAQVDALGLASEELVRIESDLAGRGDNVLTGLSGFAVTMQITGADRNIAVGGIRELRGQLLTQDAGQSRTVLDGGGLHIDGTSTTAFASATGQTLTIADNLIVFRTLSIGTSRIIDGVARNGTVMLTNPANQFMDPDFGRVLIRTGATLGTFATASGATGFGPATPGGGATISLAQGTVRIGQSATPVNNASAFLETLVMAGGGTLTVDRGTTAGTLTTAVIGSLDSSTQGVTLALNSAHDSLGVDERIRFLPALGAQAYRTADAAGTEMLMVQPSIYSISGGTARFVDFDPAQNLATGPGFTIAVTTPLASEANFASATTTTIGETTAPITLTQPRAIGALRVTANLSGTTSTPLRIESGGMIFASNNDTVTSAPLIFTDYQGTPLFAIPYLIASGNGTHTISGKIRSDYGLVKAGPGTLALTADNSATLSGNVYLNEGTLAVTSSEALGAIDPNELRFNGGTLRATGTFDLGRFIRLNAGGGTIDVTSGSVISASRQILGTGGLTKTGSGTLDLTNFSVSVASANNFSGGVYINGGALRVHSDKQLGAVANTVTINNLAGQNARLEIVGTPLARQINLVGSAGIDVTFSAEISGDITGPGSLTKGGDGALYLTSGRNSYLGGTVITAGSLVLSSPGGATDFSATGAGPVVVKSGASLEGSGIISGSITAETGATIAPEAVDATTMPLRGQSGLTLDTDANFRWSFYLYDEASNGYLASKFTLDDGLLNVAAGANFLLDFQDGSPADPTYRAYWNQSRSWNDIIDVTGLAKVGIVGAFDIDNSPWAAKGYFSTTTALGGAGVDLTWTTIPEPSSLAFALSSLAMLAGCRRFRRVS